MKRRGRKCVVLGAAALAAGACVVVACTGDDPPPGSALGTDGGGGGDSPGGGDAGAGGDANGPDSSDAADAHVFTPSDLGARLVLWYEGSPKNVVLSDAGDGKVETWTDLSTFNLNATVPLTLNACGGPTYEPAEAGAPNVLDFVRDCAKLGDESSQPNLDFGEREFLIEVVASVDRGGSTPFTPLFKRVQSPKTGHYGQVILTLDVGHVSVTIRPDDADAATAQSLVSASAPMDDKALHVVAMRRFRQLGLAKDTLELRVDGVHEDTQVDPVVLDLGASSFTFGGDHAAGPNVSPNLRIAEMIVVAPKTPVPIKDDEVKAIEDYLRAKYATP